MSAINIFRRPDAVHVLTDGAQYYADGTLGRVGQKVLPVAHLNCAFAARGPKLLLPLLSDHLGGRFVSFDDMLGGIVEEVMVGVGVFETLIEQCSTGTTFDLFIAGWSHERSQGESYVIVNHGNYGILPWTLQPLDPVALAPMDQETFDRIKLTDQELKGKLDPVKDGLRIIEAQRHTKGIQGDETEPSHGVGGFAQLTTINANTIKTRIIKRWPDPIGEKLNPERQAA